MTLKEATENRTAWDYRTFEAILSTQFLALKRKELYPKLKLSELLLSGQNHKWGFFIALVR